MSSRSADDVDLRALDVHDVQRRSVSLEAHSGRWVDLSNSDKLLIPGKFDNSGCGGSFRSG